MRPTAIRLEVGPRVKVKNNTRTKPAVAGEIKGAHRWVVGRVQRLVRRLLTSFSPTIRGKPPYRFLNRLIAP